MGMIKWIFCDVDGCITSEASIKWNISELSLLADYCRRANNDESLAKLTLCTGRPQPYAEALAKFLDIQLPMICESGAVIYTLADNCSRFAPEVTPRHIEAVRRLRDGIAAKLLPRHPDALLQFGKHAQISIFSQSPALFATLHPEVEQLAGADAKLFDIKPSHHYLNISLRIVNKGSAAMSLAHAAGLTRAQVAAIGDTDGDLPLREAAGFLACPANATPAMKERADYVSRHAELPGVMDILQRINSL